MEENKELIIVKQLPVIEEYLENLSIVIDGNIKEALELECTDESVKLIKKKRTELTKQFKELESKRKEVKNTVLAPYNSFEEIYKRCVTEKFNYADTELKRKIDEIESSQKAEKEEEVRRYFEELKEESKVDFITYEQIGIKVGLSDSLKSLKESAKAFVERVTKEVETIELQEHKEEILVEYMKDLDINRAIKDVSDRHMILDIVREKKAEQEEQKITDEEIIKKIDSLTAPTVEETEVQETIHTLVLRHKGTKNELERLIKVLDEGGFNYEQCK